MRRYPCTTARRLMAAVAVGAPLALAGAAAGGDRRRSAEALPRGGVRRRSAEALPRQGLGWGSAVAARSRPGGVRSR